MYSVNVSLFINFGENYGSQNFSCYKSLLSLSPPVNGWYMRLISGSHYANIHSLSLSYCQCIFQYLEPNSLLSATRLSLKTHNSRYNLRIMGCKHSFLQLLNIQISEGTTSLDIFISG